MKLILLRSQYSNLNKRLKPEVNITVLLAQIVSRIIKKLFRKLYVGKYFFRNCYYFDGEKSQSWERSSIFTNVTDLTTDQPIDHPMDGHILIDFYGPRLTVIEFNLY